MLIPSVVGAIITGSLAWFGLSVRHAADDGHVRDFDTLPGRALERAAIPAQLSASLIRHGQNSIASSSNGVPQADHRSPPGRPVFLDRDGVVNVDRKYVHRIADFEFTADGVDGMPASGRCRVRAGRGDESGPGIARGLYTVEDFRLLSEWMAMRFTEAGHAAGWYLFLSPPPTGFGASTEQSVHLPQARAGHDPDRCRRICGWTSREAHWSATNGRISSRGGAPA